MTHILLKSLIGLSLITGATVSHAERFNNRDIEMYHIFDIRTTAPKNQVIKATQDGFNMNVSKSDTLTPIVMDAPPETPARFKLVNPFENAQMFGFAGMFAMAGQMKMAQFKQAQCDGAVWIAKVQRKVEGSQILSVTLCLFPYRAGFQLDLYGHDVHQRGGGLGIMLGRAVGEALVGNEDDWTRHVITDIIKTIQTKTNAQISWVEGQPELDDKYQADLRGILNSPATGLPLPNQASTPAANH